jgi:hypothetical protein
VNSSHLSVLLGSTNDKWAKFAGALNAPACLGVYVIRIAGAKTIGRLRGNSDLIYIGQGKLRLRTKAHRNLRSDFRGKGWLLHLITTGGSVGELEIGFFPCENPEQSENELLFRYFTDHLELPPANNKLGTLSVSQKAVMAAMGLIPGSTSAEGELFLRKLLDSRSKAGGGGPQASRPT